MKKIDKIFLVYILILFLSLAFTFQYKSILSDEGTHLLLSVFYKDLFFHGIETGFGFENLYDFGINYLVHYPKLQVIYPPLFHFSNAFVFSVFGISELFGKFVSLLYAILSFSVFYLIISKVFNKKLALVSTILFSLSPISLLFISGVFQDFVSIFWLLLSIYSYVFALEKGKTRFFALTGFFVFLSVMGKQMGGFIILFFICHMLFLIKTKENKKQNIKNLIVLLLCFSLPLTPYLFALQKIGGFEINKMVAIDYAFDQGEPVSIFDVNYWTSYVARSVNDNIFLVFMFPVFLFYILRKNPYWKYMLSYFLLFYILLSLIPNKEPRFAQFFLLPVYLATAYYLLKDRRILVGFIVVYFIFSASIFVQTLNHYPIDEVAEKLFNNIPEGGNIATFTDKDPVYSSAIMWHLRLLDKERKTAVYRKCIFDGKNSTEIEKILQENNIYFITKVKEDNEQINLENISLFFNITKNNITIEIYKYDGFFYEEKPFCNYICLTKEAICSK
ncbi:MAG: glycosyltransferase family 39 protein [Candidatus Aenigmarchaeota archaeon]|nr:glycosyltransferase family 39 protein [Candidatus Aenigmarchaeota archaeon]